MNEAPTAEASGNAVSVAKALVVEGCSKTQTSLKSIIGTGSRDRLLCCTSGSCGSDSIFCPWSLCSPSPKNSISERYELLILLQQPACLALIPDFVETHNYTERDLMTKTHPQKIRALSSVRISLTKTPPPCSPLGRRG